MSQDKKINLQLYLNSEFQKQNKTILDLLTDGRAITTSERHDFTTKTELEKSLSLAAGEYDKFLSMAGNGIIEQIFIYNDQTDYRIRILIDDVELFNELHSWFVTYNDYLDNLSAFADGAFYVLSMRNIYFKKNFILEITAGTATTLTVALVKYTLREGRETK